MRFTVFGARGFIGSALVEKLRSEGHEVNTPIRENGWEEVRDDAGHVIYAIGLTGDFRYRPFETVNAHVTHLSSLLQSMSYSSFLYLSSTRVYGGLEHSALASEDSPLIVTPSKSGLYDLSKLLGEALCLVQHCDSVRVARLSNVYGPGQNKSTFLGALLEELSETGEATIQDSPVSSKDYINIYDVVEILIKIAKRGKFRLYNVASGKNTTHLEIAEALEDITGGVIRFTSGGADRRFPTIDISLLHGEFGFEPRNVTDDIRAHILDTGG